MAYDILSDDVLDDSSNKRSSKRNRSRNNNNGGGIPPLLIHFLIILVIVAIIFGIFFAFFNGNEEKEHSGKVTFIGDLEEFNETYQGDLQILATEFVLNTQNGIFEDKSKEIHIKKFSGNIYFEDKSLNFEGVSESVKYGNNLIKIGNNKFNLTTSKKSNIKLFFDEINLTFNSGSVKLDNTLNFKFENSSVNVKKFNMTLSYDGTFSLSGNNELFTLSAPNEKLKITYDGN